MPLTPISSPPLTLTPTYPPQLPHLATLTAYVPLTWDINEDGWRELCHDLRRAAWWASTCDLTSPHALTVIPAASTPPLPGRTPPRPLPRLTPCLLLTAVSSLTRNCPPDLSHRRWTALRGALCSGDWLSRLDDAHLDLILQYALMGELVYA
jgi:hypothetical protein